MKYALVTSRISGVSLGTALRRIVDDLGLGFFTLHEAVVIGAAEVEELALTTVAYPLHDLAPTGDDADLDELIELLMSTVAAPTWDEVGGPGSVSPFDHWLLVTQSDDVHRDIERFFSQLRQVLNSPHPETAATWPPSSPAEIRLREILNEPGTISFHEQSLREVAKLLSAQFGCQVVLDEKRLGEAGLAYLDQYPRLTCDLPAAPLHRQLDRLLGEHEICWISRGGTLVLTTPDAAEDAVDTAIYDVRLLADPEVGVTGTEELRQMVTAVIDPKSWSDAGGPGSIECHGGLLVVSHSASKQRHVAGLIGAIFANCLRPTPGSQQSPPIVRLSPDPIGDGLEARFRESMKVDFCGEPLNRALEQIASELDCEVIWDRMAKRVLAQKWRGFPPVTRATEHGTLGTVLDHLLRPLWLEYRVCGGELHILQRGDGDELAEIRLYRSKEFLAADSTNADSMNHEKLIQRIANDLGSQHWVQSGGSAEIVSFADWLVVRGSWELHQDLADWFTEQRTGQRPQRAVERAELRELENFATNDHPAISEQPSNDDPFVPAPPGDPFDPPSPTPAPARRPPRPAVENPFVPVPAGDPFGR
ncbi:MAG: hypothetical protein SFU86_06930 [Pirellulaceae bacterium]|nr:hypothetical protein [Pirellulaceae bacterium]